MVHEGFTLFDHLDDNKEIGFVEAGKFLFVRVWNGSENTAVELDLEACDYILTHLPALVDKIRAYTKKLESE